MVIRWHCAANKASIFEPCLPFHFVLQVGSMLINRVKETDKTWHQDVTNAAPRVSPIVDLMLDDAPLLRAIDQLNLIQLNCKLLKSFFFSFFFP